MALTLFLVEHSLRECKASANEINLLHVPVLPIEVMKWLDPQPGQVVVDATVGIGGHSALLWERIQPSGTLIAFDQDPAMLTLAKQRLPDPRIIWIHRNFEDLPLVLDELKVPIVDAILADLGFCSNQLSDPQRGLSFQMDGPLIHEKAFSRLVRWWGEWVLSPDNEFEGAI